MSFNFKMRVRKMYSAWVKIDDSLPWIELKEMFQSESEAKEAMKEKLSKVKVKIVPMHCQRVQLVSH